MDSLGKLGAEKGALICAAETFLIARNTAVGRKSFVDGKAKAQ